MKMLRLSAIAVCLLSLLSAPACVSRKKFASLQQRVEDLSSQVATSTADADKDGVIDSRDLEPRTPADVEVDRYGRTVVVKPTPEPIVVNPEPQKPSNGLPIKPKPDNEFNPEEPMTDPGYPTNPRGNQEPSQPAGDDYHTVVKGDTLFSLARRYNTTVQSIRQLNKLVNDHIEIGQNLRIR